MKPTYYITTPIYYVNAAPHIGHAYTSVAADVLARFKRLDGYDVMFLTGTDEHGEKVAKSAKAANMEPKDFADMNSQLFRMMADTLNVSYDDFIRTTEERHKKACAEIWKKLDDAGEIYLGRYTGWYSTISEEPHTLKELTVTADGVHIAPDGSVCEKRDEPSYFFRLSRWRDKLLESYEKNPELLQPASRWPEIKSFLTGKEGGHDENSLEDLSISRLSKRCYDWGIPVPNDPDHVMYVWFDALTNYISALGYPDPECEKFKSFWPADVHMVGKEITRFHMVTWPAMLMAAGIETPKRVFGHGWWTTDGEKISKSLGNTVDPLKLIQKHGLDQTRFYFMRAGGFGNDIAYSPSAMEVSIDTHLIKKFGKVTQNTLSLIQEKCDGKIPQCGVLSREDQELLNEARALPEKVRNEMDAIAFHKALDHIWLVVRNASTHINRDLPRNFEEADRERAETILYVSAEALRYVAVITQPFMPDSMEKLLDSLAVPTDQRTIAALTEDYALKSGVKLPPPENLFPRREEAADPRRPQDGSVAPVKTKGLFI